MQVNRYYYLILFQSLTNLILEDVCGKVTCTDNNNQIIDYGSYSYYEYEDGKKVRGEAEDDEVRGESEINIYCCSPIQRIVSNKMLPKLKGEVQSNKPKPKAPMKIPKVRVQKNAPGKVQKAVGHTFQQLYNIP